MARGRDLEPQPQESRELPTAPQHRPTPTPSPGRCPGLRAGSAERAPGWCPLPASHWSRPHCRARSLFPASGPAEGEETGSQQGLGRRLPDSTKTGHLVTVSLTSPVKQAERREGQGERAETLLPAPALDDPASYCEKRDAAWEKQYSPKASPHNRPHPQGTLLLRQGENWEEKLLGDRGGEGPWELGPEVPATSVLCFRVGHHISPRLPDQRNYMLISASQRPVLELWDLSLKPASYVDVSEMKSHTQTCGTST